LGLDPLRAFLRRHRRIAIDTSVFVYQMEAHPRYDGLTASIFGWLESPRHSAVTSTITMTEILVKPYVNRNERLVRLYFNLLAVFPGLDWNAPTLSTAALAARLRAEHNMRTPDALLAATALESEATGLVTNDAIFKRVPGFETLVLEELLRPS
jgi:predicted nucleic acid-binding protein